jgi:hypothetical protein
VAIWVPCPALLVLSLQGHGEGAFAAEVVRAFETLATEGPLHVFADCESLDNYDSQLRTELTGRFLPVRERIATLSVLVKSRFVAMGVTVMNLALGGIVSSATDRANFVTGLDARLFDLRVVGFSSRALELVRFRPAEARS